MSDPAWHLDPLGNPMFPLVCASCGEDSGDWASGATVAAIENANGGQPWTCSRRCALQAEYAASLKERAA